MKAIVIYIENGKSKQVNIEAADMETIKSAISQWSVTERRLANRIITVTNIIQSA